jgi:rhodanese-related sulfurtransferase
MKLRQAITQAILLAALAALAALAFNAFQPNGIDPFRRQILIPAVDRTGSAAEDSAGAESEGIRFVSLEELQGIIEGGDPVIDARTEGEYAEGHIPGAILCDYYQMGVYLDEVLPRLSPRMRIGIYCTGPLCDDSEMLARELFVLGYTNLCVFRGGIEEWTEAGLPVETGSGEDR